MVKTLLAEAVHRYNSLEIGEDKDFLDILELATEVCQTSFAFIALLDGEHLYVKAGKGFETGVSQRADSLCQHTLDQEEVLVVYTDVNDPRFGKTTAKFKNSKMKFYAGVPLIDHNGEKMGTLCVIDDKEHILNGQQIATLKILSNHVIFTMERKVGLKLLEEKQQLLDEQQKYIDDASIRLRSFFESSTNFQVLLGRHGEIIDFNKTAATFIKGVHKEDLIRGALLQPYLAKNFVDTFISLYQLALGGTSSIEEGSTDYGQHGIIYWDAIFEPARDKDENIIGISYIIRNTTERKQKEQKIVKQNESLLSLAHIQAHEFRAPLTTIMGIMNLIKEDHSPEEDEEYFELLNQAVLNLDNKITGIVHDIEDNIVVSVA